MSELRIEDHVAHQRHLLGLERAAEREELRRERTDLTERERIRRGLCLKGMRVTDETLGPGGRTLSTLLPSGERLPAHRFRSGDLVEVRAPGKKGNPSCNAILYRVRRDSLVLALEEDHELPAREGLRLDRGANETSWRRVDAALARVKKPEDEDGRRIRDVLFGRREPSFDDPEVRGHTLDDRLDASQAAAVDHALRARDLALIHGPPGTGKTMALVELIRQAVLRGERVLACAPSNVAVDNLVERLAAHEVPLVRLGHPARLLNEVVRHSLDACVERSDAKGFAAQALRDAEKVRRRITRSENREERRELRAELRSLRDEIREHERGAVGEVLDEARVVLATCVGAVDPFLRERRFDRIVIDEAAQALEAICWGPALKGSRLVLAGDHHQLGPVVKSREAEEQGLGITLFDRLIERWPSAARMLEVQYRMHEDIMGFPSARLYEGRLVAHASVAAHRLPELDGVEDDDATREALRFVDTAGCDFDESQESEGSSRRNEGEARLVTAHVRALVDAGLPPASIAVITPYNAQVEHLRRGLEEWPELEIGSVDGFQGREKEAVIVSFVRSNERGEVGFLADDRRTNVALTRARRQLVLLGDSATLGRHPFLSDLLDDCEARGAYRSAWEFL